MEHIFTDLAVESREIYKPEEKKEIEGISINVKEEKIIL